MWKTRQVVITLSAEKYVNPALKQFAFIFQKHEFLIYTLSWKKSEIIK